jgi:hypothetical protein
MTAMCQRRPRFSDLLRLTPFDKEMDVQGVDV